ncbi:MAG: hypothetical protein LWX56_08895 [Ignavibacteria bacterium]|nr:hypothetical protein [Ignavibacteria bacterium]
MKKILFLFAFIAVLSFQACKKDDNTVNAPVTDQDAIVGTWVSDNIDVCYGLKVSIKTKKIVATFNADKTYSVVAIDSSNASVSYSGTYTTTTGTAAGIRNIVLSQSLPTSLTSSGIYQVGTDKNLLYEVIQTTPAINGFTAPVADSGFGSTKYNGAKLSIYVQKYVPAAPVTDPLIGSWVSDGANIAPGLKSTLKTKKITATFNSDKTYTVVATDSTNAMVTYSGTYTTTAVTNASLRNIVLTQNVPTAVTSTGIYQMTATGVLYYEVLQTTPAINGFTAPTTDKGFGSTSYQGYPLGATWIQKFVKQ